MNGNPGSVYEHENMYIILDLQKKSDVIQNTTSIKYLLYHLNIKLNVNSNQIQCKVNYN